MRLRGGALATAPSITFLTTGLVQAADRVIPTAPAFTAQQKPLDLAAGEAIYKNACLACHGVDGAGGHGGGPTPIGRLDAGQMRLITTTGRNNMPTFKDVYDANQIRDVAEYITTILPKGAGAAK